MKITLYPSASAVKGFLKSHSWLGLTVGAVMYLLCLSGTLLVFSHEFERWEQPGIEEYSQLAPASMEKAVNELTKRVEQMPETVYIILPTQDLPSAHVSAGDSEWFIDADGNFLQAPREGWLHMLRELHYYLHLPHLMGIIIVGIFGAMLLALIFSGILSHPGIVKEAFNFRVLGRERIAQTDIHNRLSVWGLPFHIIIALTGAYIGLISIIIGLAAPLYFQGDRDQVIEAIYGADPSVSGDIVSFNYEQALTDLQARSPQAQPIYIALHKIGTDAQFMEVAATLPNRLIYSEIFRYNSQGDYVDHQGFSDGDVGRQAAYSVYRLHFGHFGGFLVKVLYAIFGLALTLVSVTGINIWLAKRNRESRLNRLWAGFVWGLPVALASSALIALFLPTYATPIFWMSYGLAIGCSSLLKSTVLVKRSYKGALVFTLFALVCAHFFIYRGEITAIHAGVNVVLLIIALVFVGTFIRRLHALTRQNDAETLA